MTDNTELKRLAEALIAANDLFNESPQDNEVGDAWSLANDRFTEAASPEFILALIADNERLTKAVGLQVIRRFVGDDDQKNIDELVAAGIQVDKELIVQLKAENERLAAACERAEQIIIVECKAASLAKVRANLLEANRDQLRAEVAGLRTGYEAYERVNAELKAEVEGLRKLGPSKEIIWCACGDGYPVNSYGAGFMAANGDVCENCDAANGRVEPHLDTPDELKALRQALTDIFNHVEGNTECLVRDLVNWGTPRINPNDFYDECEAIKEIANAALGQGEQP